MKRLALAVALLLAPAAMGQVFVSINRMDYDHGPAHLECWLTMSSRAAQYAYSVLTVDCVSDVDGIFHNGFDG